MKTVKLVARDGETGLRVIFTTGEEVRVGVKARKSNVESKDTRVEAILFLLNAGLRAVL